MNIWVEILGIAILAFVVLFAGLNLACAGVRPDDPATLARTRSLSELIASATCPVHIVYVHGMSADGPGFSDTFRKGLCKHVAGLCPNGSAPRKTTKLLPLGPRPNATYLNHPIWQDDQEWQASTPFVDRYEYQRGNAPPVIVDEVNWWPLLFPPKCRFIVHPEIDLSGVDERHLKLCAASDRDRHYYPWITESELQEALAHKPISGGGACANAYVKQQIMNWGLTDAVLALGPLRMYFRQAINQAFDFASKIDGADVVDQEFVVVSASLGSFVVLDAFGNLFRDSEQAQRVGERTADLYFLANQFALLQLGRIDGLPGPLEAAPSSAVSPVDLLRLWATSTPPGIESVRPKQVVAFSDPSDLLTFPVPKLRDSSGSDIALVVNVYDRNEWSFLRLFANPASAHGGHAGNKDVLDVMFR